MNSKMQWVPRFFGLFLMVLVALVARSLFNSMPTFYTDDAYALELQSVQRLAAKRESDHEARDLIARVPISMGFSEAFSKRFTKASGTAEIDFRDGRIAVSVSQMDPLPPRSVYEIWLVENSSLPGNTAAIDSGPTGGRILNLGILSSNGSLVTFSAEILGQFNVDMVAVMRVTAGETPEFVIGGMQSIRFQIGRELKLGKMSVGKDWLQGFPAQRCKADRSCS
jgi:hypothetical protein